MSDQLMQPSLALQGSNSAQANKRTVKYSTITILEADEY